MANNTYRPYTAEQIAALHAAVARDDCDALAELAGLYEDGDVRDASGALLVKRDRRRSRTYYARAAHLGSPSAMTVLADHLTPPGHSARALAQAAVLYRRAFRLGYDTAAENLAATYKNCGRHRDAVKWYRRAHAAGSPTALLDIARAELYGVGTRRNPRAAFAKLERLARERLGWNDWQRVEAMQLMADALLNGWLVRGDYARAAGWMHRAAKLDRGRPA